MRHDVGSNFTISEGLTALSRTAATYTTTAIDTTKGSTAAIFLSCGTWATSFVATLQYSDDGVTYTAEPDATAGNTVSVTLTAAGSGTLKCPNPRGRYVRASVVLGGTCVFSATNMVGPLRRVEPAVAS